MIGKDLFAGTNDLLLGHIFEPPTIPSLARAFNNHGRGIIVELIGMDPDPAMFGFFKYKGKRVIKLLMRAKPDKFARAHIDIGFEVIGKFVANRRVQPVTAHHDIVIFLVGGCRFCAGFKLQINSKRPCAFLQYQQHSLAADACKTMALRDGPHALLHHRNVVPIGKALFDRLGRFRIILA